MSTTPETTANDKQAKRKKAISIFLGSAVLIGVAVGAYHFIWGRYSENTDNAYVQGDMVNVSSQVMGDVKAILVDDNQTVKAGQVLVKLDETDAELALAQAKAQLSDTVRSVRSLYDKVDIERASQAARKADITRAQEEVSRLQVEGKRLQSELARRQAAFKQGAVSAEELESAQAAVNSANAQLAAAQAAYKQAQAGYTQANASLASSLNQTRDLKVAEHPKVVEAVAKVRQAYINLQRGTIVAPVAGQIAKRNVEVGTRIMPGTPLMTIVPLQDVWVDANFKEGQLERIRVGQPVELHADLYGSSMTFHGKVSGLSAGTGSAFSMLPAQNATGNWIKIVQRLPVRVDIDPADLKKAPLRVGLSMDVTVDTHNTDGPLMVPAQEQSAQKTTVFDDVAQKADDYANALLKKELSAS